MVSIEAVVAWFFFLLGVALIFGLLFWLVGYLQSQTSGESSPAIIWKAARIFLAVCMVAVLIGFILHVMGHPVVRW